MAKSNRPSGGKPTTPNRPNNGGQPPIGPGNNRTGETISTKDRRAQEIAARRLAEQQAAQRRQRNLMLGIGGGVIVVAIAVIAVIVIIANNTSTTTTTTTNFTPGVLNPNTADTARLTIGNVNAKVTLTEYADARCPVCKAYFDQFDASVRDQYVKTGKIKYVFKTYPVIDFNLKDGGESQLAGQAILCAADQNHSWDYRDQLYQNFQGEVTGKLTESYLQSLALKVGLDATQFNSCLSSQKYKQQIVTYQSELESLGKSGTPTFVVEFNGKKQILPLTKTYDEFKANLDAVLAQVGG